MKRVFRKLMCATLTASLLMSSVGGYKTEFIAPLTTNVYAAVAQVGIAEAQGWLESAWVEWKPTSEDGVAKYQVSYSGNGITNSVIDDHLVRKYGDGHWRADIVGLAEGNYTIKVTALNSTGGEIASETRDVAVEPHDRNGFTFSPKSTFYDENDPKQCGAYKGDGTLKDNAVVLYITSAADVSNITYGSETGLAKILDAWDKVSGGKPLAVRFVGKINANVGTALSTKPGSASSNTQITLEGIGNDATLGFGLHFRNAGNVEVRNLAIYNFADDGISMDTANTNMWVHNNEIFYGAPGSDADQVKGDGSVDLKGNSKFITVSYNHFWDSGKASLCGMKSESGPNFITYHHNWFDHSDSRHPRIRTMFVHIYNNYYDGNAKYGVGVTYNGSAFVEGNYFRNCKHPMLVSQQGSELMTSTGLNNNATLSGENGGVIKAFNNYITGSDKVELGGSAGTTEPIYYNASDTGTAGAATHFDAYKAGSRAEAVPSTVTGLKGGATFNNSYVNDYGILEITPDSPEVAKANVEKYAGRVNGGDFKKATNFAFTSADDISYAISTSLKSTMFEKYGVNKNIGEAYTVASIGGATDGSGAVDQGGSTGGDTGEGGTGGDTGEGGTGGDTGEGGTGEGGTGEGGTGEGGGTGEVTPPVSSGDGVHNFTTNGTASTYYKITGNLAKNKGTVNYGGMTLTQCLKMESSTNISFTNAKAGKLTLVAGETEGGSGIKIDGKEVVFVNKVLTVDVAAGTHTITKSDIMNLFYMAMVEEESGSGSGESSSSSSSTTTTEKEPDVETTTNASVATGNFYKADKAATAEGDVVFNGIDYSIAAGQALKYAALNQTVEGESFTGYVASSSVKSTLNIDGSNVADTYRKVITLKPTSDGTISIYMKLAKNTSTSTSEKSARVIQKVADGKYTTVDGTNTASRKTEDVITAITFPVTAGTEYVFVSRGTDPLVFGVSMTKDGGTVDPDPTPTYVIGDVNKDGTVDKADVKAILAYAVDKTATIDTSLADYNNDGKVTVKDAYAIAKAIKA